MVLYVLLNIPENKRLLIKFHINRGYNCTDFIHKYTEFNIILWLAEKFLYMQKLDDIMYSPHTLF